MKTPNLYYVQNLHAGFLGNSPVFYGKAGNGYTQWLDDAEQFTWKEFVQLRRSTRGSHKWQAWPAKQIDAAAQRTVDIQRLRRPTESAARAAAAQFAERQSDSSPNTKGQ